MTKLNQKTVTAKFESLEEKKALRDRLQADFDAKYPGFYSAFASLTGIKIGGL